MKVGIIGAGRVGCALASALKGKEYTISGVYSRREASVEFLNQKLNSGFENDLVKTVKASDIIFITVSDSNINTIAEEIAQRIGQMDICSKVFLHCSGSLTADVLYPLELQGGYIGSLHPLQTFADKDNSWMGLTNIFFGFEGCSEAYEQCEKVVKELSSEIIKMNKESKVLYHAAACILSNYTVTLSYLAGSLFEKIGIDSGIGIKALTPLLNKTIENIGSLGVSGALTGPISRGDSGVIEGHLKALKEISPNLENVYKLLGRYTADVAVKKGTLDSVKAEKLRKILK